MKPKIIKIIRAELLYVIIPLCIGFGLNWIVKRSAESKFQKEVSQELTDFTDRFTNLVTGFGMDKDGGTDQTVNAYILRTFALHQQVYRYTVEKRLLDNDLGLYNQAVDLLKAIQNWQELQDRTRQDFLSGMGLAQVYVIESENYSSLVDEYSLKTCIDVLKIDPDNKQAQETIKKITRKRYSN